MTTATSTAIPTAPTKPVTAAELLAMPRGYDNDYELIRGVLVEKPFSDHQCGAVIATLGTVLNLFVVRHNYGHAVIGNPGYHLEINPDTVRAPDVAWTAPGRIPPGTWGYPNLAPDLTVEVKSIRKSHPEMRRKAEMWLSFGTRQVWVADPAETTITRYAPGAAPVVLTEDDTIDGGDLLPGFTAPVWSLFRWQR